jgi:acetoin utilization deacetylase AcuC-like enzyme
MADNVGDEKYLATLFPAVRSSIETFEPEIIFYVGGADPFREDQLGGLKLSMEGLQARDGGVFEEARKRQIPVVTVLAGGYARRVEDTVQIHANTILTARAVALQYPPARRSVTEQA